VLPINFCGGPNEIVAQLKQCRAQSAPIDVDEDALPDQSAGQQGSASRRPPEDSNRREIIEPAWKFSALAESQMQAMQGAVFFYLPSMLLSGFMFPFDGMPKWARVIGEALPLTHFVRAEPVSLASHGRPARLRDAANIPHPPRSAARL